MFHKNLQDLPFEAAVRLFTKWGFLVQPGPRTDEVTLILEGPTRRSYCVCSDAEFVKMAAAVLAQRLQTGAMMLPLTDTQ